MTVAIGRTPAEREVRRVLKKLGQGCVRARRTTAQSVNATTWTTVIFNVEDFDPCGWYDTATGKFTPKEPGYYFVTSYVEFSANETSAMSIGKNGTGKFCGRATGVSGVGGSALLECNGTTDYIVVQVYTADAAEVNGTQNSSVGIFFAGYNIP